MSVKAYAILTYILIPFALFFGVIDFVLLLSALANPSALIFVFIVACLVIYTFVSLKFLRTGLQKEQIMAKSLKDWIKVNAYVSLFLCSLFSFLFLFVFVQAYPLLQYQLCNPK